jgi:hypothetical protein
MYMDNYVLGHSGRRSLSSITFWACSKSESVARCWR